MVFSVKVIGVGKKLRIWAAELQFSDDEEKHVPRVKSISMSASVNL